MIIFVSGATKTVKKCMGNPFIGQLITPRGRNKYIDGMLVAADNSAFSDWNEKRFMRMLDKLKGKELQFVAAPDVVGDAVATSRLYDHWQPIISNHGFPVALVLQDGQEGIGLPADWKYDAIFIGGTTAFKLGDYVRYLVGQTKEMGKWIHMGRVNSFRRVRYAYEIGCDSIDGTKFSIEPDAQIERYTRYMSYLTKQAFFKFKAVAA